MGKQKSTEKHTEEPGPKRCRDETDRDEANNEEADDNLSDEM